MAIIPHALRFGINGRRLPTDLRRFAQAGSTFDTVLAVYQAVSVTPFRDIGYNDDHGDVTDGTSRVRFQASAGVTYSIAVDGFFWRHRRHRSLVSEFVSGLTAR